MSHNEILGAYRDVVQPGLQWENFTLQEQAHIY